ncbi:MAG: nucleoside deaminase [Candidatus Omnitrophota bacterium]|nr:MAG: nucleoside deaminase [Candidatus Omnitrophota bacterium]
MRIAIAEAKKNLKSLNGGPFGACIVKGKMVLAAANNTVLKNDATCHAEINAIREASSKIGSYDLKGCVIYSTTEPCPMCFSAIHWARINKIVFGTGIKDAIKVGFNELKISSLSMKRLGSSKIDIVSSFLYEECLELFKEWVILPGSRIY